LTDCAPALWAFAEQTPPPPWGPRHLIAWLADERERLPAKALAGSGPIAVHDSCFTSRRLGLGSALREVVAHLSGEPPRELFEHGDAARCCGAEGGWAEVQTEAQGRAADTVLADITDSGARWVVTGSTTCRNSLRERIQRHEREEGGAVEVLDPFDLLILAARAVDEPGGST
jgi:Fe-S oxidoreductase